MERAEVLFSIVILNRNLFGFYSAQSSNPVWPSTQISHSSSANISSGLAWALHVGPYLNNSRHFEHLKGAFSDWLQPERRVFCFALSGDKAITVFFLRLFLTDKFARLGATERGLE